MDKSKLKSVLDKMSSESSLGTAFKAVENEMKRATARMKREAESQATDFAKKSVEELRGELRKTLQSLVDTFSVLESNLKDTEVKLNSALEEKVNSLRSAMAQFRVSDSQNMGSLAKEIGTLRAQITEIGQRKVQIPDFGKDIKSLETELNRMILSVQASADEEIKGQAEDLNKKIDRLATDISKVRSDAMSALVTRSAQGSHGGNANRNILVNNNSSTLSRYGDLNIKAGNNITLTYGNNDNLKTTDLTIAATGGAAGGITRTIATTAVSSTLGAIASTDYVVIASAGVKISLPTAANNTNLYTIKNTSTSSIMVVANGAETIDGQANIIMPVQYTSVDLISDNSNWQIT